MKRCLGFARIAWSVGIATVALSTLTVAPAQAASTVPSASPSSASAAAGPVLQTTIKLGPVALPRPVHPNCLVCIL